MSVRSTVIGLAAGAAGVAAAGTTAHVVNRRRMERRPAPGEEVHPEALRSARPLTVVADDGLPLHAEVDELDVAGRRRGRGPGVTLVFVHGYALNLDCWHFQRSVWRGRVRSVYYDQRSHGRSGRSKSEHCTIDQLGRDLVRVLEDLTGDDPVVLVGHSMGGMTILALAEQRPDLFGTKIAGVGLLSTTAGGLDPGRVVFPMLPAGLGPGVVSRMVGALSRGHRAVDTVRTLGRDIAITVTDLYAFGDRDVPAAYLELVWDMLAETPFQVVADFYPAFATLDKWHAAGSLGRVPTAIMCGTADRLTGIGHSRKLHSQVPGSDLLECEGAGHMVLIERHEDVNDELESLVSRAVEQVAAS
jgi:pimeloyl-ACP methyl ester carboxylesterase